jgi:hypothetical protein
MQALAEQSETVQKVGRFTIHLRHSEKANSWFVGVEFNGRANWRLSGYLPTHERALAYIEELRSAEAEKESKRQAKLTEKRTAREAFVNPYKVGDVMVYSWGYDQTNIEFAQVIAVGPRSVTLRTICGEMVGSEGCAPMSGHTKPIRDKFTPDSKPFRVTIQIDVYGGRVSHRIPAAHGSWSPAGERETFYVSWYA